MGVDGFREDVITYISKKEGLPDDHLFPIFKGMLHYNHGPHVHEYLREFKEEVLDNYDCMTLAEAPLVNTKTALRYIEEGKGEMDMMIQFQSQCADCLFTDFIPLPFSLRRLKHAFSKWQRDLQGKAWNMLYLENHDHPRVVSRYGSEDFHDKSAKCLATAFLFLQGSPFLYQGQEIGMTNWRGKSIEDYRDVQSIWKYHNELKDKPVEKRMAILHRSARDNARTPVQWSGAKNGGFTEAAEAWMPVNENYAQINVADQEQDPDSILNFYRRAIGLRKELSCVRHGVYKEYRPLSGKHYIYSRKDGDQELLVVCSFAKKDTRFTPPRGFDLKKAELVLGNYPGTDTGSLKPYECRAYLWKK